MAKYDFMSFGEPNIRMTPPNHDRLGQSDTLQLGIAAAELNCCVNISNLSVERLMPQKKTAYVTKLDGEIYRRACKNVRCRYVERRCRAV